MDSKRNEIIIASGIKLDALGGKYACRIFAESDVVYRRRVIEAYDQAQKPNASRIADAMLDEAGHLMLAGFSEPDGGAGDVRGEAPTPNTYAGFRGGFFAVNRVLPTEQEIWNAGVKSGMQRAAPSQPAAPAVRISKVWASGGTTGWCDYLMTDNSIRTLKVSAVTPGQEFPPNNGGFKTVAAQATAAHAGASKDSVSREQIEKWAKMAGIPTMFEKHIEQLGDFAIFARRSLSIAAPTPVANSGASERTAYETWWKRDVPQGYHDLTCVRNGDGKYAVENCQQAWEGWQARAAAKPVSVDAGAGMLTFDEWACTYADAIPIEERRAAWDAVFRAALSATGGTN